MLLPGPTAAFFCGAAHFEVSTDSDFKPPRRRFTTPATRKKRVESSNARRRRPVVAAALPGTTHETSAPVPLQRVEVMSAPEAQARRRLAVSCVD